MIAMRSRDVLVVHFEGVRSLDVTAPPWSPSLERVGFDGEYVTSDGAVPGDDGPPGEPRKLRKGRRLLAEPPRPVADGGSGENYTRPSSRSSGSETPVIRATSSASVAPLSNARTNEAASALAVAGSSSTAPPLADT
ncbi:hypothetical protein SAMN04487905_10297 [Actinopolyspora xinjiangensis]|uniref:Uncharacterized protein n=1 Tax=Actinopolyspora xinjiangensis TaxID=405564 RepID=A0A1H0Q5V4_9ACTN|nr:hypothetical protein SAMN04487905_10297 [Actinopolyspora xinjiangensis]